MLFKEDSLEDLICRGFDRSYIINSTQIDPGYNNSKYKSKLKGINRIDYKIEHISQRKQKIINDILDQYANGATRNDCFAAFGIQDKHDLSMKHIYSKLNMHSEFKLADKENKKNYMTNGMLKKFNTDNPFKLKQFQNKALETRALNKPPKKPKIKKTKPTKTKKTLSKKEKKNIKKFWISNNETFRSILQMKNDPTLSKKAKKINTQKITFIKRYGVEHTSKLQSNREKAMKTNLKRHGYPYASQNPLIRAKIIKSNMDKYGVPYSTMTKENRTRQRNYMLKNKKQHYETKKKNKTINSSNIERQIKSLLLNIYPDVTTQYFDEKRYPYYCDFYIPSRDLFIEVNAHWTHNKKWFDPDNADHIILSNKWSKKSKYYQKANETWTVRDVSKRNTAKTNKLNYLTLWCDNMDEINLWVAMGCPDAKDWHQEYSWINTNIDISKSTQKIPKLTYGDKTTTKIARQYAWPVIFKEEIKQWENHTTAAKLLINRYKYLQKLPNELTPTEIIKGFHASGMHKGYSAFNNKLMKSVIKKYNITSIVDPCAGWGERILTAKAFELPYSGYDINPEMKNIYTQIQTDFNMSNQSITINDSSQVILNANALITCPPYGNKEIYSNYGAENKSEIEFLKWWSDIVRNSNVNIFAFQINQKWKKKMSEIVETKYDFIEELTMHKQISHLNKPKGKPNKKEYESMMIFKKR